MDRGWTLLCFSGSAGGFYLLLLRNPDIKIVAKEQEWFVVVVWYAALHFMPFMLICNFLLGNQIKNMCKDSWFLNAFLSFIFLVIPAVIDHLDQYPKFHINVKDVKQHNSQKKYELFAACSFAISSWGLSKTYDLTFESGLFSVCLEHAMKFSLALVNQTGKKRDIVFILGTFGFCLVIILCRKYLEKKESRDSAMQRESRSSDNNNTADQRPNDRTDGACLNPFAACGTNYLRGLFRTFMDRVTQNESNQPHGLITAGRNGTLGGISVQDGNIQRYVWQDLLDINEQNGENFPLNDTSSNSADTEDGVEEEHEEVASVSIASGVCLGKREESEVASLEIEHEERDTRSSTSSGYMEITDSSKFRGYVKDDVPLLPPKSDNMIDGGQTERSKDQSQEGSHGYEIDDNPLLPKNTLKVDNSGEDNDDFITRSEITNYFAEGYSFSDDHAGKTKEREVTDQEIGHDMWSSTSCHMKLGGNSGFGGYEKDVFPLLAASNDTIDGDTHIVNTGLCQMDRSKDQSQESRSQGYETNESPLSPKSSLKVYNDDPDHESFDGEGSNGFHGKAGCKLGVDQEDKDPGQESDCQEQENVRPLMEEIPSDSNSGADDIPLCLHKSKKTVVDFGQMKGNVNPRDGINYEGITKPFSNEGTRKPSNSDSFHDEGTKKPSNEDSSDDEGGDDSNNGARCKVGVCWRGRNKCHVTESKDITNLDNMRLASRDEGSYGHNLNNGTASEVGVGQRGRNECPVKEGKDIIISHTEISNRSAEGTNDNDDCVGNIEEREVPGQEIGHEEPDTRSSTTSSHMKIAGSTELGDYENDDVPPLLLTKSDNIINGETQIVKGQMERSKYQSKESDSDQDYQIDDNPLLRKSSLKVDKGDDDDNDSNHESSDDDDFHSRTGSKIGVGQRHKDPGQKIDGQNQGHLRDDISDDSNLGGYVPLPLGESMNVEVDLGQIEGSGDVQDEISYEGIRELFSDEGTNKPSDDLKDDSFGDEGNDGDDFNRKAGCKFGRREKNKCPVKTGRDITNLDESRVCKPKEEKKQLQAVKFKMNLHCDACKVKIMKILVSLSGVDSVAVNCEQQEVTVTGNVDANEVQKKMAKSGRKVDILSRVPSHPYAAPAYDMKAPPAYVGSLESTATVGTKLMPAGGYDMKAPPGCEGLFTIFSDLPLAARFILYCYHPNKTL